jgi:hypothetical protein
LRKTQVVAAGPFLRDKLGTNAQKACQRPENPPNRRHNRQDLCKNARPDIPYAKVGSKKRRLGQLHE